MTDQVDTEAPTPYQPEEGAVICLAGGVPLSGWQVRGAVDDSWCLFDATSYEADAIVEARRLPRPGVTITLPADLADWYDDDDINWGASSPNGRTRTLIREARAAQ